MQINRMFEISFERALPPEPAACRQSRVPLEHTVALKMKIDASQAYRVFDEFEENQISRTEDGNFIVSVSYPEDEWVYGWILSQLSDYICYDEINNCWRC